MRRIWLIALVVVAVVYAAAIFAIRSAQSGMIALYERDYATARADLRARAEAGDGEAAFYLGVIEENGYDGAANPVEAARWYLLGARRGVARAVSYYVLDVLVANPSDTNCRLGVEMAKQLADAGFDNANLFLARVYHHGWCGEQDPVFAAYCYRRASARFPGYRADFEALAATLSPQDRARLDRLIDGPPPKRSRDDLVAEVRARLGELQPPR